MAPAQYRASSPRQGSGGPAAEAAVAAHSGGQHKASVQTAGSLASAAAAAGAHERQSLHASSAAPQSPRLAQHSWPAPTLGPAVSGEALQQPSQLQQQPALRAAPAPLRSRTPLPEQPPMWGAPQLQQQAQSPYFGEATSPRDTTVRTRYCSPARFMDRDGRPVAPGSETSGVPTPAFSFTSQYAMPGTSAQIHAAVIAEPQSQLMAGLRPGRAPSPSPQLAPRVPLYGPEASQGSSTPKSSWKSMPPHPLQQNVQSADCLDCGQQQQVQSFGCAQSLSSSIGALPTKQSPGQVSARPVQSEGGVQIARQLQEVPLQYEPRGRSVSADVESAASLPPPGSWLTPMSARDPCEGASRGDAAMPVVHRYNYAQAPPQQPPAQEGPIEAEAPRAAAKSTLRRMIGQIGAPEPPALDELSFESSGGACGALERLYSSGSGVGGAGAGAELWSGTTMPLTSAVPAATAPAAAEPAAQVAVERALDEEATTSFVLACSPFAVTEQAMGADPQAAQQLALAAQRAAQAQPAQAAAQAAQTAQAAQAAHAAHAAQAAQAAHAAQAAQAAQGGLAVQAALAAQDVPGGEITPMPLQPRLRGLPGNTAPGAPSPGVFGGDTVKPGVARQASASLEPSPSRFPRPGEVLAEQTASTPSPHRPLLSDNEPLTVAEAAAEVRFRDLAELRSFRNPPAVVCQVLEAVAVLLGVTDARWPQMRKLLDGNFLHRICSFDPAQTTFQQAERLRVLLQVPTFRDGTLGERCPAVVALAAWCNAVGRELAAFPPQPTGRLPRDLPRGVTAASDGDMTEQASLTMSTGSVPPSSSAATLTVPRPDLGGLVVEPDIWRYSEVEILRVRDLSVSREGVGSVTFHGETDCRELLRGLADLVVLNAGEVIVYPNQKLKPDVGMGLNKPASIVLYGCLPKTQGFRDRKAREKYKKRVRTMTEDKGAEFIDYDCDHGVWQFRVAHF